MHYRIKTNLQYAKTACARNVPKNEATTSRMSVTCETCMRYIEQALENARRPVGNYTSAIQEKAVDNVFSIDDVKHAYNSGDRACLLHTDDCGDIHVYTQAGHNKYMPVRNPDFWQALRAYQDAERKKGVPIDFAQDRKAQEDWYMMNVGEYHKIFTMRAARPVLEILESYKPKKRGSRQTIAVFTNFRWRAGYPKGGNCE